MSIFEIAFSENVASALNDTQMTVYIVKVTSTPYELWTPPPLQTQIVSRITEGISFKILISR